MKKLFFLLCLFLSVTALNAQSNDEEVDVDIHIKVSNNPNGGYNVNAEATSEGRQSGGDQQYAETKEDIPDTAASAARGALGKLGKKPSSNVKAGPNGEGDYRGGSMPTSGPGDFPPIVIVVGDNRTPKFPGDSFIMNYKNMKDYQRNHRRDLSKAIDKIMK